MRPCRAHLLAERPAPVTEIRGRIDYKQLPLDAQTRQRQWRLGAAGDKNVHRQRQVIEENCHRIMNLARFDDVIVIKNQAKITRKFRQRSRDCRSILSQRFVR